MDNPPISFDLEALRLGRDKEREATVRYLEAMAEAAEAEARRVSPLAIVGAREAVAGLARNLRGAAERIKIGGHR